MNWEPIETVPIDEEVVCVRRGATANHGGPCEWGGTVRSEQEAKSLKRCFTHWCLSPAAAESLRREGEAGENQWEDDMGNVYTFSRPTLTGGDIAFGGRAAETFSFGRITNQTSSMFAAAFLAWHSRAYTLAPDECREPGKPPRKLEADEVRGEDGGPLKLEFGSNHLKNGWNVCAKLTNGPGCWLWNGDGDRHNQSPFNDPAQYARALAFWSRNAPASLCIDGNGTREMREDECRDARTGEALKMRIRRGLSGEQYVCITEHWNWYPHHVGHTPREAAHPCSSEGQRLRVEGFLAESAEDPGDDDSETCQQCVGVGSVEDFDEGEPSEAICAACRRTKEESDAEERTDGRQAAVGLDGPNPAGGSGVPAVEHVQPEARVPAAPPERPPGVPATATVWAEVVDGLGRKVGAWFDPELHQVTMVTHRDSGRLWTPKLDYQWGQAWMGPEASRPAAAQCRQLYEVGLAAQAGLKAHAEDTEPNLRPACLPAHIAEVAARPNSAQSAGVVDSVLGQIEWGPGCDYPDEESAKNYADELQLAMDAEDAPSPAVGPAPVCPKCGIQGWVYEDSSDPHGHPCNCPRGQQVALDWDMGQLRRIFSERTAEQVVAAMSEKARERLLESLCDAEDPDGPIAIRTRQRDEAKAIANHQAGIAARALDREQEALARAEGWQRKSDQLEALLEGARSETREALARAEKAEAAIGAEVCAYCGAPAEGNHTIHRDGYGEGPEVPLCDAHGSGDLPNCEQIWAKIAEKKTEAPRMPEAGKVEPHWMEQRRQLHEELEKWRNSYAELDRVRMEENLRLSDRIYSLETTLATTCAALTRAEAALTKINVIRNSIVAMQKTNFSEHVYPLVAALNEAGVEGMDYPEALANFGTMLERTVAAEARASAAERKQVDLGELREVMATWTAAPGQLTPLIAAVEKLLSEDTAPPPIPIDTRAREDLAELRAHVARLNVPYLSSRVERLIAAIALAPDFNEVRNRCDRMRATGPSPESKP